MKKILLIALLLIFGCSKKPINYKEVLVARNDVFWTKDTNEPYSGPVFSLYENGDKKEEGNIKKGKRVDKWVYHTKIGNGKYDLTYLDGNYSLVKFTDNFNNSWSAYTMTDISDLNKLESKRVFYQKINGDYDFSKFPSAEVRVNNGVGNGQFIRWNSSGKLKKIGWFGEDGDEIGIPVYWDDNGEVIIPSAEIRSYKNLMSNSDVPNTEKLSIWKKSISNLEYASRMNSNNPSIWFMLGEVYDDVSRTNHQEPKLASTIKKSSYFEKVLELDPLFDHRVLYDLNGFTVVDQYSKIISSWCSLAHAYKTVGKQDSAIYAYKKAFEIVGLDHPLIEYGKNILRTCDENGILFVGGDNDTYPLWYLQDVEKFRTDVAVINMSLLNTNWYIKEIRDSRRDQKIQFINLTDEEIDIYKNFNMIEWKEKEVVYPVNTLKKITWTVKPTRGEHILLQDKMVMQIINDAQWKLPIYFAITVPTRNRIGLDDFLEMDGMAYHLISEKSKQINPIKMEENLNKYTYKTLTNPITKKYYSLLLRNYHSIYAQLAVYHYLDYIKFEKDKTDEIKRQRVEKILDEMFYKLPSDLIPYSENLYYQMGAVYYHIGNEEKSKKILTDILNKNPYEQKAKDLLEKIKNK